MGAVSAGGQFSWVIDQVSADGDSDTVRVFFLGSIVDYYSCVCDGAVCRDILDLVTIHEKRRCWYRRHQSYCRLEPSSFPKAVVHTSCVTGSLASFLYLSIVTPVTGWTTGLARCCRSGIKSR
eukprot:scaffold248388_cov50-Cyclotella_meneghiniana.AAC.3